MPEDAKLTKAQKLAAARKKLKEYQQRSHDVTTNATTKTATYTEDISSTVSTSSNLSERSESELNLNGHTHVTQSQNPSGDETTPISAADGNVYNNVETGTAASYFMAAAPAAEQDTLFNTLTPQQMTTTASPVTPPTPVVVNTTAAPTSTLVANETIYAPTPDASFNTLQVLITEKAQLTTELTKLRGTCRERELELEELRVQLNSSKQRDGELNGRLIEQQGNIEQLRKSNAELQHKLAQTCAQTEDQQTHVVELQQQLTLQQARVTKLEQENQAKCNELEMAQLRVRQLSDETNIGTDNRVEALTQTQYMYEQQIRDLQAMVQQLTHDKEQANTQYQTYAQHLNAEISKLNERNVELSEENVRLQQHEKQLVEHVSGLEREIQKNLSLQAQFKEIHNATKSNSTEELSQLKERLAEFDFERHEFQLKIKSQEDKILATQQQLSEKDEALTTLQEQFERIHDEQPDKIKLLATMESDKVAASRALTQNVELKKQLDELELRFVQLTNDKAELVNQLDAEEFANREMRTNFAAMEEKLHSIDERFKFKDEEMIRLSHENMDLTRKNLILQQQLDRLQHYEVQDYHKSHMSPEETLENATTDVDEHVHCDGEHHEHHHQHEHEHEHDHGHGHANHVHSESNDAVSLQSDHVVEATEEAFTKTHHHHEESHNHPEHIQQARQARERYVIHTPKHSTQLETAEAVEKLQGRFTQLISQVADLTDDKQRLEHLVLQLQSETETIGEYIALYQTQRRMLKQREYEKAAQMKLLEAEREQLREKITMLNNLVSSLGVELPKNRILHDKLKQAQMTSDAEADVLLVADGQTSNNNNNSESHTPTTPPPTPANELTLAGQFHSNESQQILHKIQDIISEIKENTEQQVPMVQHTVDHLNCCLGKVEVV